MAYYTGVFWIAVYDLKRHILRRKYWIIATLLSISYIVPPHYRGFFPEFTREIVQGLLLLGSACASVMVTSTQVVSDKMRGSVEHVVSTPVSPRALWVGKTLASALASGLLVDVVSTLILLYLKIAYDTYVLTGWEVAYYLSSAFFVSLAFSSMTCLAGLLFNSLIMVSVIVFLVFSLLINIPMFVTGPVTGGLVGYYLLICFILLVSSTLAAYRLLGREKIVCWR